MSIDVPITSADFYETLPENDHRTGDIWRDLPIFGHFRSNTTRGIVVTPACDLAQKKTDAITYLPIISADEYLGSYAFRYDCWQEIQPLLSRLPDYWKISLPTRYGLLDQQALEAIAQIERDSDGKKITKIECDGSGKKFTDSDRKRIAAYVNYVAAASHGNARVKHLRDFFKPDRLKLILERLVKNSLKVDVHFLPKDGGHASYSAIPDHSVVLFRYPLTIPVMVIDEAQRLDNVGWVKYCEDNKVEFPVLINMPKWPIKLASLRGEFLSDMLSRYINMYIRLGSADFADHAVQNIVGEIGV